MSYVVGIWEQPAGVPLPTSVDAAVKLLDELYKEQPGQNPKFIILAQRLTRRFPCLTTVDYDEIPESERAWVDGPFDGICDDRVFNLGLNRDVLDVVQPFVVVTANALGLNVMDDQAGDVYLADGTVLSDRPEAHCVRAAAAYHRGDLAAAVAAYRDLAAAGNPVALERLGTMYDMAEGVPKSRVIACALLLVAAGNNEKKKQLICAGGRTGKLAASEVLTARNLAQRMTEPGKFLGVLDACQSIDSAEYVAGEAAARAGEYAAALRLLTPLAEQGHPEAGLLIGMMHEDGRGVAQSVSQASHWYRQAARNGNAWAASKLGTLYQEGKGVEKDDAEAVAWFRQAAAMGEANALHRLGMAYGNGAGVSTNRIAALALLQLAQGKGAVFEGEANVCEDEAPAVDALLREIVKPGMLLPALDRHLAQAQKASAKRHAAKAAEQQAMRWVVSALAFAIVCHLAAIFLPAGSLPLRIAVVLASFSGIVGAVVTGRRLGASSVWMAGFAFGISIPMFGILPAIVLILVVFRYLAGKH